MKILIPSAKEMHANQTAHAPLALSPSTEKIIQSLKNFTIDELITFYKVRESIAQQEYERIQNIAQQKANSFPAIHLFNGLMYRNITWDTSNPIQNQYIEKNVFITSALYGIINAMDYIQEHRLDFQQKLKIDNQSLKSFWRNHYNAFYAQFAHEPIISLLSSEFEDIFDKSIREKFIKITFTENGKIHSTISKKARGKFLSQMIQNHIYTVEALRQLTFDNFKCDTEKSTETHLYFEKTKP